MFGKLLGKKSEKEQEKSDKAKSARKDSAAGKKKETGPGAKKDKDPSKASANGAEGAGKKAAGKGKAKPEASKPDRAGPSNRPSPSSPSLNNSVDLSPGGSARGDDGPSPRPKSSNAASANGRPPPSPTMRAKENHPPADEPVSGHSSVTSEKEAPEEFVCPLSLELMYDPVIVSTGQTYERAFIMRWIEDGHTTCPKTRQPLDAKAIFPNQVVKMMIEDWCHQNGVPTPTQPKVVAVDNGLANLAPANRTADGAARARALALESQRRQRVLMEQMAAARHANRSGGGGSNGPARRSSSGLGQDSIGGVDIPSAVFEDGPYGQSIDGLSLNQVGTVGSERLSVNRVSTVQGTPGSPSPRGNPSVSDISNPSFSSTANPSLNSINSFSIDGASWPGPLAMQAHIFQNMRKSRDGASQGASNKSGGNTSLSSDALPNSTDDDAASTGARAMSSQAPGEGEASGRGFSMSSSSIPQGGGDSASFSQSYRDSDTSSQATSATDLKMPDVIELVDALKSDAIEEQAAAVALLRVMTRYGTRQAKKVARAGAIVPLIALMKFEDEPTQEHAVTTLLNICLNEDLKPLVRKEDNVIDNMVHVLTTGMPQARGNAAAALYLLSTLDGVRDEVQAAGALPGLIQVLEEGSIQARKDAANCLLSLALAKENRKEIAESGVIKKMCSLLQEGEDSVEEQTAAICASLVRDVDGRGIMFEEGAISVLAELVEVGASVRCREYAVNALLGLAVHSKACLAAIDEEGITASIDVLTRTGSTKTQAKATALLELLWRHANGE